MAKLTQEVWIKILLIVLTNIAILLTDFIYDYSHLIDIVDITITPNNINKFCKI